MASLSESFDGFTKAPNPGQVIHNEEWFTRAKGQILKLYGKRWYPLRDGPFLARVNAAIEHFWSRKE